MSIVGETLNMTDKMARALGLPTKLPDGDDAYIIVCGYTLTEGLLTERPKLYCWPIVAENEQA